MIRKCWKALRIAAAALSAAAVSASYTTHDADACGGFFSARPGAVPSLQVEQVLIVHDTDTEVEHFVRQISFRDARDPFGFVVPTPSMPTVAKVDGNPFPKIESKFPMKGWQAPSHEPEGGSKTGQATGTGGGVDVLSTQKVGSFTAFVLQATDAGAMKKWLDENRLTTTSSTQKWISHYVEHGFFFVAFRFDPPPPVGLPPSPSASASATDAPPVIPPGHSTHGSSSPVKSETVRISFSTPLPYYPYLEPDHSAENPVSTHARVLAVWLVSQRQSRPIAVKTEADKLTWRRPWVEGKINAVLDDGWVKQALGPDLSALLPDSAKSFVVQRFEDQKIDRSGWGDVVLVPATKHALRPDTVEKYRKLMSVVDPSLAGAK